MVLIFLKWPVVGICVEVFGFINLFGDFFPVVLGFLRQLPVVGPILRGPYIGPVRSRYASLMCFLIYFLGCFLMYFLRYVLIYFLMYFLMYFLI